MLTSTLRAAGIRVAAQTAVLTGAAGGGGGGVVVRDTGERARQDMEEYRRLLGVVTSQVRTRVGLLVCPPSRQPAVLPPHRPTQAGEMESLRAEIAMLRRKGGMVYASAPVPIPDVMYPPPLPPQPRRLGGGGGSDDSGMGPTTPGGASPFALLADVYGSSMHIEGAPEGVWGGGGAGGGGSGEGFSTPHLQALHFAGGGRSGSASQQQQGPGRRASGHGPRGGSAAAVAAAVALRGGGGGGAVTPAASSPASGSAASPLLPPGVLGGAVFGGGGGGGRGAAGGALPQGPLGRTAGGSGSIIPLAVARTGSASATGGIPRTLSAGVSAIGSLPASSSGSASVAAAAAAGLVAGQSHAMHAHPPPSRASASRTGSRAHSRGGPGGTQAGGGSAGVGLRAGAHAAASVGDVAAFDTTLPRGGVVVSSTATLGGAAEGGDEVAVLASP